MFIEASKVMTKIESLNSGIEADGEKACKVLVAGLTVPF
jgi:hypothetical protein